MAKLKCRLKGLETDPYYKLAPIKEETMQLDPGLWVIHDILSPQERRDIIKTASPFVSHFFQLLFYSAIGTFRARKGFEFKLQHFN